MLGIEKGMGDEERMRRLSRIEQQKRRNRLKASANIARANIHSHFVGYGTNSRLNLPVSFGSGGEENYASNLADSLARWCFRIDYFCLYLSVL